MAETPENPQAPQPERVTPAWPRPIPRLALVLIGSPCTAVGAAIAAKDWCWTPMAGGFIAAVIIVLADMIVLAPLDRHFSWGRKVRLIAVLVTVCTIIFVFRLDAKRTFRVTFGQDPPPSVTNLIIDSGLHIGPDQTYLIRFSATRATIDQIVANRPFRLVRETTEGYPESVGWDSVWNDVFGTFANHGGPEWKNVQPMKTPLHFSWENGQGDEKVDLLWDAESGRAYVRYLTL